MIRTWSLRNFKSVSKEENLIFKPLTIFAGANSSGKSTIIHSILLTAQTLQNRVTSKSVVLNGHVAKFGSFLDVLSTERTGKSVKIGFELNLLNNEILRNRYWIEDLPEKIESLECEFTFSSDLRKRDTAQLEPHLEQTRIAFKDNQNSILEEIRIKNTKKSYESIIKDSKLDIEEPADFIKKSLGTRVTNFKLATKAKHGDIARYKSVATYVGAETYHFIPMRLIFVYDKYQDERRELKKLLSSERRLLGYDMRGKFNELSKPIKDAILKIVNETITENQDKLKRYESFLVETRNKYIDNPSHINFTRFLDIPPLREPLFKAFARKSAEILNAIPKYSPKQEIVIESYYQYVQIITEFFQNQLNYLGPLRDDPKPIYPLIGSADSRDIGFRGENTAAVLQTHKDDLIEYIPSSEFDKGIYNNSKKCKLKDAVLDWLGYMGVASNVSTQDMGKLGHEMKIATQRNDTYHDLTHVGVGVSQVLPILVQSLLASQGSTLIFEQPELHLHPRVQTRLADFFVSLNKLGKQCIVETHSEYLINRLRYLVATVDDKLNEDIVLYFVEKKNLASNYRKIVINKYGVIEDWPEGFFDESEELARKIIRAGFDKKSREKTK